MSCHPTDTDTIFDTVRFWRLKAMKHITDRYANDLFQWFESVKLCLWSSDWLIPTNTQCRGQSTVEMITWKSSETIDWSQNAKQCFAFPPAWAQIVCDYIRLKILGCVGVVVIAANRIWKVGSWLARLRHNSYATLRPPLRSRDRKMTWHLDGKVRICVTSVAGLSFVCRMNGKFSGQTNSAHANAEDIPPENPKADHMRSIHSRRKYISVDRSWWRYRWLTFTNTMYSLCSPFRFWRSGMARENREWTDIEDNHRWVCTQCPHSNDRESV